MVEAAQLKAEAEAVALRARRRLGIAEVEADNADFAQLQAVQQRRRRRLEQQQRRRQQQQEQDQEQQRSTGRSMEEPEEEYAFDGLSDSSGSQHAAAYTPRAHKHNSSDSSPSVSGARRQGSRAALRASGPRP